MQKSLSSLMNAMIKRLEQTQPEELSDVPESNYWQLIHIYIKLDGTLAALYKQYCERKAALAKLLTENGANDPMTEIASDMYDSAKSAVDARLIELKNDETVAARAAQMVASKPKVEPNHARNKPSSIEETIAFLMMVNMVTKNQPKPCNVKLDFAKAS